jgi:hypothetical protein
MKGFYNTEVKPVQKEEQEEQKKKKKNTDQRY